MLIDTDKTLELRHVLKIVGLALLLTFVIAYVVFQARFLIIGPKITLTNEPNPHHNNRVIALAGKTENITHLWLNDRQIFTDENGEFNEALVLENGYTITTLRAIDRYGRETEVMRSYVYTPASFISN